MIANNKKPSPLKRGLFFQPVTFLEAQTHAKLDLARVPR
jgi:hypothetical protein